MSKTPSKPHPWQAQTTWAFPPGMGVHSFPDGLPLRLALDLAPGEDGMLTHRPGQRLWPDPPSLPGPVRGPALRLTRYRDKNWLLVHGENPDGDVLPVWMKKGGGGWFLWCLQARLIAEDGAGGVWGKDLQSRTFRLDPYLPPPVTPCLETYPIQLPHSKRRRYHLLHGGPVLSQGTASCSWKTHPAGRFAASWRRPRPVTTLSLRLQIPPATRFRLHGVHARFAVNAAREDNG